jgi:glutamyl-tRNA reductase
MTLDSRSFVGIGFSHLLAPLDCRERAMVAEADVDAVLRALSKRLGAAEVVLLSTCSRLEVYAVSENPEETLARARGWFLERAGAGIAPCLTGRLGSDALHHLFSVTAGLDSWILGESEILGQVKRAYEKSRTAGLTGPILNRAFQSAAAAGKNARAKTGIQNGIHSIGGAAAVLARSIFGANADGMTVVFGAGEAAQATVRHLAAKNFSKVLVANRTLARAEELARVIGGRGVSLEQGLDALTSAEIAVFSISTPVSILTAKDLRARIAGRRRPLFLIDLGLPRNIEAQCAALPGVYLYNLDDLKGVIARSIAGKAGEGEKAAVLVAHAVSECAAELDKAAARRQAAAV